MFLNNTKNRKELEEDIKDCLYESYHQVEICKVALMNTKKLGWY